jgi:hypothetical protein
MTLPEADEHKLKQSRRSGVYRVAAVVFAALSLAWPALYNRFPLLYPDSMAYLNDGPLVARAVFLHRLSNDYGVRSLYYSLGILPFHWNVTAWPIVGVQCLLAAWVVWLVVRSIAVRRAATCYLILMLLLSLLTSAGWYASFVMPDILGPILYLSVFLLVFARDTLSRGERWALYPVSVWAITSHATHLLLAGLLCVVVALFTILRGGRQRCEFRAVAEIAALVAVAVAAQLALYSSLYGKLCLNGEHPPFVMGRLIDDGPAREYLEKNCGRLHWAVCKHLPELSKGADSFLWDEDGVYQGSPAKEQAQLSSEEMPLIVATVRAYPRQQLARSAANFREQLVRFAPYGFGPTDWILAQFDHVLPASRTGYVDSRQARDDVPVDFFEPIQFWTVVAALVVMAALVPLLWRRHSARLAALVIISMVVANAAVTGALSVVDDRYQCRVIWLIPLLAGVTVLDWLEQRRADHAGQPGRFGGQFRSRLRSWAQWRPRRR